MNSFPLHRRIPTLLFRFSLIFLVVIALVVVLGVSRASAQPNNIITVNIATDGTVGDHKCSLIEAISVAESQGNPYPTDCAAAGSTNTIQFSGVTDLTTTFELTLSGTMTIDGGSGVTIHASTNHRTLFLFSGSTITLKNLTLTGGNPSGSFPEDYWGGGIYLLSASLFADNVTIENNTSCDGGGIYAEDSTVTLLRSTLRNNSVQDRCNLYHAGGGGISFHGGNLYVKDSTFLDNTAIHSFWDSNESFTESSGNAIFVFIHLGYTSNTVTLLNSTIQQHAAPYFLGTVLDVFTADSFQMRNVTLDAGEISTGMDVHFSYGDVENSIVTKKCGISGVMTLANNLATDATCAAFSGFTLKTIAELNMLPIANNGGPTQTIALGAGSAAIDAGENAYCSEVITINNLDQRGYVRPVGAHCDVGAYEANAVPPPTDTPTPTQTPTKTATPVPPIGSPTPTMTATATVVACASAPSAPKLKTPAANSTLPKGRINLKWSAANCATSYNVTVKQNKTVADSVSGITATHWKTKMLPKGTYTWFVQACNTYGCTSSPLFKFKLK